MSLSEQKKQLRKKIKKKKKSISTEERDRCSNEILAKIEQLEIFQKSRVVMAYWSLDDEVHTHDFIIKWSRKKTILLPVIRGRELKAKQFTGIQNLIIAGQFGINEPMGEIYKDTSKIDLVVVPGVAFDNVGNRLGRGKGFYDNFLKEILATKIGICFDFQLVTKVPVDDNDIRMNAVIAGNSIFLSIKGD